MPNGRRGIQRLCVSHHLIHGFEAKLRHDAPHVHGHEAHEALYMLGRAREKGAQSGVLRGHSHGTGVEVALPHHDAAQGNQGDGAEAELLRAQKRGDDHVPPGAQLPVHLHADAVPQPVCHQGLLRIRQSDLPGDPGVLDGGNGGVPRSSVIAADEHHVRLALCHAGGDGAHADLGNKLHGYARLGVCVLQVEDELRKIFY